MATSTGLPDNLPRAEEFLRLLLRSGLMDRAEVQSSLRDVPRDRRDDATALADHLVRRGKLTRFQASKLLNGFAQGLIIGPFRVLAPLGKGGMGTVFLVRDQRNGELLALKILPPKIAREETRMLERFLREMALSQRVAHPHLCQTREVGAFRGVHYIAMEYIPGKTLHRTVIEEGPLPLERAARLFAEVASGLAHAHAQGLIHRDLKPANILVTPRDHARVLDLGLALSTGETVTDAQIVGGQGYIVGTMDYIAPEQTIDATRVDGRSDLYSLGCSLYFAVCGQPPFPGGTSKEKVMRHRHEQPTPLGQLVPGLPAGFLGLVSRLMARHPDQRPDTAEMVEAELRTWAIGGIPLPVEQPGESVLTESEILKEAPGSAEYNLVGLPEVEFLDGELPALEEPHWPPWLVLLVVVILPLLLMTGFVAVMVLLFSRT